MSTQIGLRLCAIIIGLPLAIAACSDVSLPAAAQAASSTALSPSKTAPGVAGEQAAQPEAGYDWLPLRVDGDTARLQYGKADTDDIPLEFSCQRGGGIVLATVMELNEGPSVMQLASAGQITRLPAHTMLEPSFSQVLQRAHLRTADPLFERMLHGAHLSVHAYGEWQALLPHPGTKLELARFLTECAPPA